MLLVSLVRGVAWNSSTTPLPTVGKGFQMSLFAACHSEEGKLWPTHKVALKDDFQRCVSAPSCCSWVHPLPTEPLCPRESCQVLGWGRQCHKQCRHLKTRKLKAPVLVTKGVDGKIKEEDTEFGRVQWVLEASSSQAQCLWCTEHCCYATKMLMERHEELAAVLCCSRSSRQWPAFLS